MVLFKSLKTVISLHSPKTFSIFYNRGYHYNLCTLFLKFFKLLCLLSVLYLFPEAYKFSESKQLNRSEATSHFFWEELNRKGEDNFGNSSGNKKIEVVKSKFQREQRTRTVFSKTKNGKSTKFSDKFVSLANELERMEQVKKRNEDFMERLMKVQKQDTKEREIGTIFFLNQRRI